MKRTYHIREIREAARAARIDLQLVREGAEHEIWRCGDVQFSIPRHRELTPGVIGDNRRKLAAVLGGRMVAQVKSYSVIATQEERFWLLSVPELDIVTQARTLDRAEATVRDLIAVWLDIPSESFTVVVEPRLDDDWVQLLRETKDARSTADQASARASELLRTSVTTLHEGGLSAREVGSLVGISYQRVQQLLAERVGRRPKPPRGRR